jgi:hypothetical protein
VHSSHEGLFYENLPFTASYIGQLAVRSNSGTSVGIL